MITLREYAPSDASRLVQLANNQKVSQYLIYTFPYPYTRDDAEWWIATGSREQGAVTRVIDLDGLLVGSVGITPQTGWRSHLAEIGYWLGEEFWGRGIATEAVWEMTAWALADARYRKLLAPVLGPNRGSMRVLEKNGYSLEGVLRNEVMKNGRYIDVHQYARLTFETEDA